MFKLWSENKPSAKKILKPSLGLRNWDELSPKEKLIIWQHLEWYFFDKDEKTYHREEDDFFDFEGDLSDQKAKKDRIFFSIYSLNSKYKVQNYAASFLENMGLTTACKDFFYIFINQNENVVYELLSMYCKFILKERADENPYHEENETDQEYEKRTKKWRLEDFDKFAKNLNEVFEQFEINVFLTHNGFIPKQDKKIIDDIYTPVLISLSDNRWRKVNEHLSEAFDGYQKKQYSSSITNTISAIQAFLQIIVNGKIGKGKISELIQQAQKKDLIPNDVFSIQIFNNVESIFARERQSKSGVHPRLEIADEKTVRLILNLAMVFIQHCIQS